MSEWTLSSFHEKKYGDWAGNPVGIKPDPERCCESIWTKERWSRHQQCGRRRGFGPEKAYCKQHDPDAVAARKAVAEEKYQKEHERDQIKWSAQRLFAALCKIADGDNDPRATAAEAIKGLKRPAPPSEPLERK